MENDALRLIRVFHNLNRTEVAKRVGLSVSYVSELESGAKKVTLDVLHKYAEGFNIPVSSLMLFAEQASSKNPEEDTRRMIGGKIVKMLSWLAALTEDREETESGKRKEQGATSA